MAGIGGIGKFLPQSVAKLFFGAGNAEELHAVQIEGFTVRILL